MDVHCFSFSLVSVVHEASEVRLRAYPLSSLPISFIELINCMYASCEIGSWLSAKLGEDVETVSWNRTPNLLEAKQVRVVPILFASLFPVQFIRDYISLQCAKQVRLGLQRASLRVQVIYSLQPRCPGHTLFL